MGAARRAVVDWAGAILGRDLVWRRSGWVAQPGRSFDTAVKRAPLEEFDVAVRNTYEVLLTRGRLGSLLYSTDPETQELLRSLLVRAPVLARSPGAALS